MALLAGLGAAHAAVIDLVLVGDPGNAVDVYRHGAVGYIYQIGKYEVTNGEYIEFLNAVARISDPYGLYSSSMGNPYGGIARSGSPGNYTYGPKGGDAAWLNRPVNYINFWDACRFANWLHNRQPTGPPGASTTEDGAYTLNGYLGQDGHTIARNPGARWAVPTLDEWYKAAYYKGGSTNAGYWWFPTQSNSPPSGVAPPGASSPPGSVNVKHAGGYYYYTTPVGAYIYSSSAYGTFDQGGNLWEWTETLGPQSTNFWPRTYCGGSYIAENGRYTWGADAGIPVTPLAGFSDGGFRVVYIPEPATAALLALGGLGLIRRRQKC